MKLVMFTFNWKTIDSFPIISKYLSINHSITRTYSVWYALLIHKWNIKRSISIKVDTFRNTVNTTTLNSFQSQSSISEVSTIIHTLKKSKSFTSPAPKSQSPETDVNLAIRPKTIISSMLVLIPVIHENKWYGNCLCPFSPFAQWAKWRTVMIHRLFTHSFYWLKAAKCNGRCFQDSVIFSSFLLVPNFVFRLLGGQNISIKFIDTVLY